ncbi:hypothetical protein [Pseudonocardia sp. Ae717_Ps2]|uniref:hypothetical protein n=1 Tax=Pseudonocardia sp. Ae717_Ps2 TaxID=1885573 RepID=UPI00094B662E|nr:hypothetical protein [Pseudonocardia sp. Ae717_Ps2]
MPDTAVVVVRCAVTAALASVRPSAAALGNDAKSAATAVRTTRGLLGRQDQALRDKYRARRELAAITSLSRVKKCGRVSTNEGGEVSLHHTPGPEGEPGTAGFGGLATCGSVWACPVCSAKISARRSKDLEQLINWNADRGARSHC